jgi:sugar phosphate isomerase/epimerase
MPRITLAACWSGQHNALPPEEGLPRIRDAGFTAIEIWSQDLRRWGVPRWKAALVSSDLGCAQLCPYLDVVHGPSAIEMGRWVLEAMLAAGSELGCRRIRVFTGPPWGRWTVGPAQADEQRWREAADGLAEYCDTAGPGTELCLECHDGSLMQDAASARRLIDLVARPNLTVNLQLPFAGEDPLASAEALAPWTTHVHIHAYEQGWSGPLTWLSSASTNWEGPLRTLLRLGGRDLCLSVEHPDHGSGHDAWETLRRDGPWLHGLSLRLLSSTAR